MSGEGDAFEVRDKVVAFASYEDYLDAQVSELDMYYLEDEELARQLIGMSASVVAEGGFGARNIQLLAELGYRGTGDVLKREEFEARKKADQEKHLHKEAPPKPLSSMGKDLTTKPFLQALAAREELVRNGKLTCILFIRHTNSKGQEISGYIDYAHRLKLEEFEPYFDSTKLLLPRPTDLSFYNWETQTSTSNSSPNFQVLADNEAGLLFKNKRDRKVINVDPRATPGDNTTRTEIRTTEYLQCVIYDHYTRRKG